jgi:hypothetical protein
MQVFLLALGATQLQRWAVSQWKWGEMNKKWRGKFHYMRTHFSEKCLCVSDPGQDVKKKAITLSIGISNAHNIMIAQ